MADSGTQTFTRKARPEGRALLAFTLIEVVMVLVILVTFAAIAVPRYAQAEARYRLDGAARRIQADIEMARAASRADGQTRTVLFNAAANRYQITAASGGRLAGKLLYQVPLADAPYRTVIDLGSNGATFSFDVDGYGELHGTGTVKLTIGNENITLTINSSVTSSGINVVSSVDYRDMNVVISGTGTFRVS